MCGIFGFITNNSEVSDEVRLEIAVQKLKHRGPDDAGTFEARSGETWCKLAHTRLSIIDLSDAGHQPLVSEDGRYALVYNGEVYNFREIRKELESLGERFVSDCDTEVVLKSYVRWGRECLHRFRGMFAFGIWDAETQSIFLARDRLGIKPLYYTTNRQSLAFASEVRTLLATGLAKRKLSDEGLLSYFTFGSVIDPATIIEGVSSLLPGCHLTFRDGKSNIERYWKISAHAESQRDKKDQNNVAANLKNILREAVNLRLIADVPTGVFLSGGIDSSAVVALASQTLSQPLRTLTVTFDERAYNEARYAEIVARHYGCDHQEVHISAKRAANQIEDVIRALDQPSADGVNTYFISQAAHEAGLKVALSGLGGDEVFGGYDNFRKFGRFIKTSQYARFAPEFIFDYLVGKTSNASTNQTRKFVSLLKTKGDPNAVYAVLRGMFTREQQRKLFSNGLVNKSESYRHQTEDIMSPMRGEFDYVNAYSELELKGYLRNTLLRDADVLSMAHGLEVRVPLLDHVLVEYMMQLPGQLKIRGDINKSLLVESVPGLPRDAVLRPKMGFTLPMATWFRGGLKPLMENLLLDEVPKRLKFLDAHEVKSSWQAFLKDEKYVSHSRVWCIAALVGWCVANDIEA